MGLRIRKSPMSQGRYNILQERHENKKARLAQRRGKQPLRRGEDKLCRFPGVARRSPQQSHRCSCYSFKTGRKSGVQSIHATGAEERQRLSIRFVKKKMQIGNSGYRQSLVALGFDCSWINRYTFLDRVEFLAFKTILDIEIGRFDAICRLNSEIEYELNQYRLESSMHRAVDFHGYCWLLENIV